MQVLLSLFVCDFAKYIFILGLQFGITPSIYIFFKKNLFNILEFVIHTRQRKTKLKLVEKLPNREQKSLSTKQLLTVLICLQY